MEINEIILPTNNNIEPRLLSKHLNFRDALVEYKQQYKIQYHLYEGLITSQTREKTIYHIKKSFLNSINFRYDTDESDFLIFLHKSKPISVSKLLQLINNLGWFIIEIQLDNEIFNGNDDRALDRLKSFNFEQSWLTVQAKYDIEIDIPSLLYHITPTNKVDKILKIGLSPKTQSSLGYHPERVYLTTTVESAEQLISHLSEVKNVKQWTILEINTKKIPSVRNVNYLRVFKDPSFPHQGKHVGLYTLNNIPPKSVKVIKEINLK